jgi:protein gp37
MSATTRIEWADKTWSPIIGCDRVSPGCDRCYAITTANIRSAHPNPKVSVPFAGTVQRTTAGLDWTGRVNLLEDRLTEPLRWRRPARVFVNSQSDLFHHEVPDEFIVRVFAVMAATPHHTYQVLTKRHGRMRALLSSPAFAEAVDRAFLDLTVNRQMGIAQTERSYPLPNVWLGVSVEDQKRAALRVPALLDTPAAVRFISAEPLLGPVDLTAWMPPVAPMPAEEAPATWAEWTWPDWVPAEVRVRIEEFWSDSQGRSPRYWIRDMHDQGAPAFGARLTMDDGFGQNPPQVTGRYVHCWGNIGRLALDDDPTGGGRAFAYTSFGWNAYRQTRGIDWVIVGGESGPGARAMHPDWARSLRDQAVAARAAFLFKQWGEYLTATVEDDPAFSGGRAYNNPLGGRSSATLRELGPSRTFRGGETRLMRPGDRTRGGTVMLDRDTIAVRVGKGKAGRELDGREWNEYPDTAAPAASRKAA